ncbi:histone-fold-containing protein [Trichoderma ceciliae]
MAPTVPHRGGPARSRGVQGIKQPLGGKTITRHRKILRDTVQGVTKPAIRRLARRGGVIRISAGIYEEVRGALKDYLTQVLRDAVTYVEHRKAKTITTEDVLHSLRRRGRTIYGFDTDSWTEPKQHRHQEVRRRPYRADRISL